MGFRALVPSLVVAAEFHAPEPMKLCNWPDGVALVVSLTSHLLRRLDLLGEILIVGV